MILIKTTEGLLSDDGRFYKFASSYLYYAPTGYEIINDSQAHFEIDGGIIFMDLSMIIDGQTFDSIALLMQYVTDSTPTGALSFVRNSFNRVISWFKI
jgi:hypothetical protein